VIQLLDVHPTALRTAKRFSLSEPAFSSTQLAQSLQDASTHPLIEAIWLLGGVKKISGQGAEITIFADSASMDWDAFGRGVARLLKVFTPPSSNLDEDWLAKLGPLDLAFIAELQSVLDLEIRAALQRDGGDLTIALYQPTTATLQYQGACRGCGFSSTSTQQFILSVLTTHFPSTTFIFS
jgi:Fe-S cluster biogenesis protein NfuA